jgi:hypothetical protein
MPPEEEVESSDVSTAAESPVVESDSQSVDVSPDTAQPQQSQYGPAEIWGAFKSLPQFSGQDDSAVAQGLYEALQREQAASRALQQYQQIIPFASDYLRYKEPFEQWRQQQGQQQQPQAQVQPQETPWWDPPKLRDSYRQWLTKDENGREIIDPNAPLDARAALTEHLAYKADFAKKFLENPESTLGPMVEKVAVQRAEQIVQDKISRMRDEDFVTSLERDNSDWLYGQDGNASPAGLAVQKYIQDARSLGIAGAKARWDFATKMVERDLMLANLQQQSQQVQRPQYQQAQLQAAYSHTQPQAMPPQRPVDDSAQRNMEYLRQQAMRQPSQRQASTADARAPSKPMTFAERLSANLKQEGLI